MKEIVTRIDIAAPAERVWAVLSDFGAYPQWNPFVVRAEGTAQEDEQLWLQIRLQGRKPVEFRPRVIEAVYPCRLTWRGRLLLPGLFDGEHGFEIEPRDGGRVGFVQRERFTGLLVPLLWRRIETATRQGFEAMNQALKTRVEAASPLQGTLGV